MVSAVIVRLMPDVDVARGEPGAVAEQVLIARVAGTGQEVRLQNLSKVFGDRVVLRHLDLVFTAGEIVADLLVDGATALLPDLGPYRLERFATARG